MALLLDPRVCLGFTLSPLRSFLKEHPEVNRLIMQLASHSDREVSLFANIALTYAVQPVFNKTALKNEGLLDLLMANIKSKDPEKMQYANTVLANWVFELPNACTSSITMVAVAIRSVGYFILFFSCEMCVRCVWCVMCLDCDVETWDYGIIIFSPFPPFSNMCIGGG
jgi:hypothetical protein